MNEATDATEEIKALKEKILVYEKLIEELSAPIIPSIVPDTILVPLTGALSVERFMLIQEKIVQRIPSNDIHTVVIDFTDINTLGVEGKMGYDNISEKINELVSVLKLMGTETIFVGFSPAFAQHLILSNVSNFNQVRSFTNFRAGLQYLLEQKGMEIVEKK
ncbi:STAS domain-containing protein [Sporosarcina sp. GW1-11]|uniref:STAS domain-containing protein n=1 Tax=Sporosarcina sp. GW1-11 TaxID=2899126 RepID=UPI00294BCB64|nr:STAS domain-containing protein [Sporosarcina sp. GW1-11]MDV6378641.1 STAS domain-containing protein [Sporosarcina sp. GW1-11]